MGEPTKITSYSLRHRKSTGGGKIVAVTAYDYPFAKLADEIVDVLLVGDSLGMVIHGEPNTLSVTVDDVVYHSRAVARGTRFAHIVADMPFMSYQASLKDAVRNAGRLLSEGRAEAVKLEGGVNVARTVEKLVDLGIPVMGHVGLTPQSVHVMGGYRLQGKTDSAKEAILQDALAVEDAGAYAIVLEGIPSTLAQTITERVKIPTIGIGAGPHCDGQILVNHDLLGMDPAFAPKFVKRFECLDEKIRGALQQYRNEVREGSFPGPEHSF